MKINIGIELRRQKVNIGEVILIIIMSWLTLPSFINNLLSFSFP